MKEWLRSLLSNILIIVLFFCIAGLLYLIFFLTSDTISTLSNVTTPLGYKINKTYSKEYNCLNFSQDFKKYLDFENITSVIMVYQEDGHEVPHAVIGVLFDPQTNNFVPLGNFTYIKTYDEFIGGTRR